MKSTTIFIFSLLISLNLFSQDSLSDIPQNKIDSCETSPLISIIKSDNQIFTAGNISRSDFSNINSVSILSPCLKKEFDVLGFRMVGVVENKDPIVITIAGGNISSNELNQILALGNSFEVYFEDIKGRELSFHESISFKVN